MTGTSVPTPEEARALLDRSNQVGAAASAGVSWPYVATLLSLGAATSMGTLAMSLTTDLRFLIAMLAMLAWVVASLTVMMTFGRATRLGFKKRWRLSIGAWAVAYVVAIALASTSQGDDLVGGVIGAVLIAVVTITGAVVEARSGARPVR